jgi:hypothetical protein
MMQRDVIIRAIAMWLLKHEAPMATVGHVEFRHILELISCGHFKCPHRQTVEKVSLVSESSS